MSPSDLAAELARLTEQLQQLHHKLLTTQPAHYIEITQAQAWGRLLNAKRKALGIDLETLSLQTEVSVSTLKRLFHDPSQVRFATLLRVAKALGVQLCSKA